MYCHLICRVKMKKETVGGVALSSSCIISFSGSFLKYAMSLCWESGGRWQSARWSWQGPRGEEAHGETLPPAATPRAHCPSSRQLQKPNLEGAGWQANRVGPGPFTVHVGVTDDWGSQTTSVTEPQGQKRTKSGAQSRQQKECPGLKTENGQEPDPDNASLK